MCHGVSVKFSVAVVDTIIKATKSGTTMEEGVYLGL